MPLAVHDTTRVPIGTYRGLRFGLVLHPQFPPDVYLEGAITRLSTLSRDHQGPRAVLNALERLATGYGPECVRVRQDLAIAESQLRDYRERLGKPFAHDAYLSELTSLRDQLKAGLSATHQEASNDSGPTVSEMADRVSDAECESYLESLPGVGRKTARCVMMYSLRRDVFPVDSNCWRICRRLGWVRSTRPDKSCSPRDMDRVQAGVPPDLRLSLHVNLVAHGRACCLPSGPLCHSCCIREYCKTGQRS